MVGPAPFCTAVHSLSGLCPLSCVLLVDPLCLPCGMSKTAECAWFLRGCQTAGPQGKGTGCSAEAAKGACGAPRPRVSARGAKEMFLETTTLYILVRIVSDLQLVCIWQVPRTTAQFRHALHSLIKALYKRLFERLVHRINCSHLSHRSRGSFCQSQLQFSKQNSRMKKKNQNHEEVGGVKKKATSQERKEKRKRNTVCGKIMIHREFQRAVLLQVLSKIQAFIQSRHVGLV